MRYSLARRVRAAVPECMDTGETECTDTGLWTERLRNEIRNLRNEVGRLQLLVSDLCRERDVLVNRVADLSDHRGSFLSPVGPVVFSPDSRVECARLRHNLERLERELAEARALADKLRAEVESRPSTPRTPFGFGGRL